MSKEKEMTEVGITDFEKPVVKENLTSEERAREYADSIKFSFYAIDERQEKFYKKIASNGYLSALKDSEKELKSHREALKEFVVLSEAESKDDIIQYEMDNNTELSYANTIAKAKQLLKEEE